MKNNSLLKRIFYRWGEKLLAVGLALVIMVLHTIVTREERSIMVPLEIRINSSLIVAEDYKPFVKLTLSGEMEEIENYVASDFTCFVDFTEFTEEGTYKMPIQIDKNGMAQNDEYEIKIDPGTLTLALESKMVKTLPVTPSLVGFALIGYDVEQYFVSPSSVTIVGPRSIVENLTTIRTEDIDIEGRYEDFTISSRLLKPENDPDGLTLFPGGETVQLKGVITEAIIVRTFSNIRVVTLDIPENLTLANPIPGGSIVVQGTQAELEQIRQKDMALVVSAASVRAPGKYTLEVELSMPAGVTTLDYLPREVEVEFLYKE